MVGNAFVVGTPATVGEPREGDIWGNINAAERINKVDGRVKIDTDIIVDVYAEKVFDGVNGHVDTVEARMGELVF